MTSQYKPTERQDVVEGPSKVERTRSVDWRELPMDVQRYVLCTQEGELYKIFPPEVCDACPHCRDTCELESCVPCQQKRAINAIDTHRDKFTLCEVRRHRNLLSCWIVVNNVVYDATSVLERHPGGVRSIMRYSGGQDCGEHLQFHSAGARRKWKMLIIGELCYCEGSKDDPNSPPERNLPLDICRIS
mmetsp:Transcript_10415/g.15840  ORF Transcript_10415/g.15840 Transcript_10415/m.15840 type:complete len:188 (+) Transcript_10415:112-675(+)